MGNKPSAPPTPLAPTNVIPPSVSNIQSAPVQAPEIPVCDANCQRQKELTGLRTALDMATANKTSDPEAYQRARIAYYTAAEGQGWLDKERTRIGEEEVGPVVTQINDKYKALNEEKKNQSMFMTAIDVMKNENSQNKQELNYIYDQTAQNTQNKLTTDRTNELGGNTLISGSYYPLLFQVLIAILFVIIIVLLYRRFVPSITPTPVSVGGKRLPH